MTTLRLFKYIYITNLIMVILLFFNRNNLPRTSQGINELLSQAPEQTQTHKAPFHVFTPEGRFYIKPVYHYKLYGLVVSKYNARQSFMASNDKNLNVTDLCVIWGNNIFKEHYKDLTFWSTTFTCWVGGIKDYAHYLALRDPSIDSFKGYELSNNHILTEDPELAKQLRAVNIGDQIYIEGYLANYGTSPSIIYRRSSTSRTDVGNGACETLYVDNFELLKANPYRKAYKISLAVLILMTISFFIGYYYQFHYRHKEDAIE